MPDKKLDEIIQRILQITTPDKIILFGSRASGQARPNSDYDLLVIKSGIDDELSITKRIYRNFLGLGVGIDIIVKTPEDVENSKNRFISVVKTAVEEGITIYG
jgi:uncharacterized protein